ncbi:MAG: hypothetical protein IKI71_03865 [Lachnospiraceae bacterium]|nr:hypothetical protein [Lachnospiraceae bacterium]
MGWDGVEVNKILTKKEIKAKLDDFYGPLDSELVSNLENIFKIQRVRKLLLNG